MQTPVAVISEAGEPLGRELALALARHGVKVAAISRSGYEPETDLILSVTADASSPQDAARAFTEIRARFGAPTILINAAEVYPHRDILDETPESFMATLQTNLGAAFNCCHEILPAMVASGKGRIINVVTFADIQPVPFSAGYSVSKGALRILTRSLVADLGERLPGIVINDWIPGSHAPRRGIADGIPPAVVAEWGARLALLQDPGISGLVFLRDREHQQELSWKRKLKDRVLGKRHTQVRLV